MPKCPNYGCNKTAIFRRNLRCGNCDSSRHAPRAGSSFDSTTTNQTNNHLNDQIQVLQLTSIDPDPQPVRESSCKPIETNYSSCSADSYNGGGGDFGGSGGEY